MLTLNQLSGHDALVAILDSKKLSERFEDWIHTCEMDDYIGDKLREFTPRAAEWSVGTYSPSYISVRDSRLFIDCVQNSISFYGGSNRLEKLAKQCDKLRDSNLFDYMVEKLCEVYFDDEIQPTIDYVEDCGYAIYCKDADDAKLADALDCFLANFGDDYYVENGQVYEENASGIVRDGKVFNLAN